MPVAANSISVAPSFASRPLAHVCHRALPRAQDVTYIRKKKISFRRKRERGGERGGGGGGGGERGGRIREMRKEGE